MRVVYYVAASLDGRIADADHKVDWLNPYAAEELGFHEFIRNVGAVVMGRKSFDFVHAYGSWPYGSLPGVVLTHRPLPDFDAPIRAYDADLTELIAELQQQTDQDIWIVGGGDTAAQFLEQGLLDEIEVYTMPVILGDGPLLFGERPPQQELPVIATTTFSNGVVMTLYRGR